MSFYLTSQNCLYYQWYNFGKDENLVLINSLGSSLIIWHKLLPLLKDRFNILVFDKRGHGLSTTREGSCEIEDYAEDIIALMDQLEIETSHILGLSIGGLITYSLLLNHPTRFKKAIFSNTGAKIGEKDDWDQRMRSIEEKGLSSFAKATIERWLPGDYREANRDEAIGLANMVALTTEIGYLQACGAIARADFRPRLGEIDHEVMFIGGTEDQGTTSEFVSENAKAIKGARLEILQGVSHLPPVQVPDQIAQLVKDFLNEK